MKYKVDIVVTYDIREVEVEAASAEEAERMVRLMNYDELTLNGYEKNNYVEEIDVTEVEEEEDEEVDYDELYSKFETIKEEN